MEIEHIDALIAEYTRNRKAFSGFMNNVVDFFQKDNSDLFGSRGKFVIHSVKSREKDIEHLREKINRKSEESPITKENLFKRITDFCGVRAIHIRLSDFGIVHSAVMNHVENLHWKLAEAPKAYTWDPEYKSYFESLSLRTYFKESNYTSVHYVVKPNEDSLVTCEIQVRSLFEEIWGEVDHDLNYPSPSDSISCKEQLKVLAKLVGAGTKLVDSIYSTKEENH